MAVSRLTPYWRLVCSASCLAPVGFLAVKWGDIMQRYDLWREEDLKEFRIQNEQLDRMDRRFESIELSGTEMERTYARMEKENIRSNAQMEKEQIQSNARIESMLTEILQSEPKRKHFADVFWASREGEQELPVKYPK